MDQRIQIIEFWFFLIYSLIGTIAFCIGSYRNEVKRRKEAEASLAAAEDYAMDLEEEKNELASGYALMATTIESMQTQIEALIAHTEGHCQRLDKLEQGFWTRLSFVVAPSELNYDDYTEGQEEPYSESECPTLTPLPAWLQTAEIEGLNEL